MARSVTSEGVAGLIALTAISSVLGLRGQMQIWLISPLADIVFVAGTMAAGYFAYDLARHSDAGAVAAVALGFLCHWLVYAFSWVLVVGADPGLEAGLMWPLRIGWVGLVAAAGLPAAAALYVSRSTGGQSATSGAAPPAPPESPSP